MTGSELISVILPVYNSGKTLEEAVTTVLGQTYKDIELLIVDDCSTDNTPEICRLLASQDSRIRVITNPVNQGRLRSRLIAAGEAKGAWLAFIDADDLWRPEKIARQLELRDKKGCDIVYTASAFIDADGKPYEWIMNVPAEISYKILLKQNIISNSSAMVRRDDYIKYSPSGEDLPDMHEDFACWLAMLRDGLVACGVNEPLLVYRVSKTSGSGNKFKSFSLNINTYRYLRLGFFSRLYYQMCYSVNGIRKYRHFR